MQDCPKAAWSILYVSVAVFPSLKLNFIAYRSSKVSDCIFEIYQQWQSGFSWAYSNSCCSCSFEREIIKIGQSSHKMYCNNILNFKESTPILNVHTKKGWKPIVSTSYEVSEVEFQLSCNVDFQNNTLMKDMKSLNPKLYERVCVCGGEIQFFYKAGFVIKYTKKVHSPLNKKSKTIYIISNW